MGKQSAMQEWVGHKERKEERERETQPPIQANILVVVNSYSELIWDSESCHFSLFSLLMLPESRLLFARVRVPEQISLACPFLYGV